MTRLFRLISCLILLVLAEGLTAEGTEFHGLAVYSLKVENSGEVNNLFDQLGLWGKWDISPHSRLAGHLEFDELLGFNAGFTNGPAGTLFYDDGFYRTFARLDSDVLREAGKDPGANLNLAFGYGGHQELLVMEFTEYRFERAATSGIDGFNLAASVGFSDTYYLTAAFNPASIHWSAESPYPDVFTAFSMDNDHRGSFWGKQIHFLSSSLQLFYDSAANLGNNRLYDDLDTGEALTLGIGGTLELEGFGIYIFGFGMTEYFLMYDREDHDILQAQWCAGFGIPLLSGLDANLSGNNAIVMGGGEGSYINFGLDMKLMITETFGLIGAAAALGLLDQAGASLEGGVCLEFKHFSIIAGYSDHTVGGASKYAKGAFDKTEWKDDRALEGGFFLSGRARF